MPQQTLLSQYSGQQTTTISPRLLPSSPLYVRGSSRPPYGSSRTPPMRDRTPIRHHRTDESRARSSSRSNVLLAYATELQQQQQQISAAALPYRSAPNTPPAFEPSDLILPASSAEYPSQTAYYSTPMPQPLSRYELPHGTFASEATQSAYYPLSRTASASELATLNPQDAMYLPNPLPSNTSLLPSMASSVPSFPPTSTALESSSGESFRILATRQRPQCWDHGCNGRQFSTFSNLLRHQREKSGSATKSVCPHCGTEFTRTTARNGHMYGGKCKGKPDQEQSESEHGSSDGKTAQ